MPFFNNESNIDPWLNYATQEIYSNYGVEARPKGKSLLKFGKNIDLDGEEMVWVQGGTETLPSTNAIDKISSSDNGDTQSVKVEGHTLSGSDLTFVVQEVTLVGQTETSLTTPLYRATRVYNNDSTDFSGTVYVYEDDTVVSGVPQTAAKIHLRTDGTNNQSLKAATSLSSVDYWAISQLYVGVDRQTSASVDFKMQVKEYGKVWRTRIPLNVHSNVGGFIVNLNPYFIVPANADWRMMAIPSTTNVQVEAWANGALLLARS